MKPLLQSRPHAPQFAEFDATSVQPLAQQSSVAEQPASVLPLQEQTFEPWASRQRSPGRHDVWSHEQTSLTHSTPFPLPQSFLKSHAHCPALHTKPLGQALSQPPQLAASVKTGVSQPSSGDSA